MRKAFFALVVANILYFAWAQWIDVTPSPPVNESLAKLPRLKLLEGFPQAGRATDDGALAAARTVPARCLSVGPFAALEESARAATLLRARGFDPRQRAEEGHASEGFWVYVSGMKSEDEAVRALTALEHNGIKDAVVMPETADAGRRLSLGLYSERTRAERRAEAVRQAGLNAEVAERKFPGTVYWVDLSPQPGMSSVPIQDLFAQGVSSHIAVQPCPASGPPKGGAEGGAAPGGPPLPASGTASAPGVPASAAANTPSGPAEARRKLR
jgi:hypothetical protein